MFGERVTTMTVSLSEREIRALAWIVDRSKSNFPSYGRAAFFDMSQANARDQALLNAQELSEGVVDKLKAQWR